MLAEVVDKTLARRRVQRRMIMSAVAEARVLPLAAVKADTWTATVCPGKIADVVV